MERRLPADLQALVRRSGTLAEAAGGQAYLVGGVVRDVLLDRVPRDVDVVVEGDAKRVARVLAREVGGRAKVHDAFGTATVTAPDGRHLDLATARSERYARPGALPQVGAGDLRADLFRRDFTVNAMAVRLDPARFGELVDPFGGRRDLRKRRIRVLHDASFLDDPTRALRAARLAARLHFEVDPETRALLRAALREDAFARISTARLAREIERLLSEPSLETTVRSLARLRLVEVLHPDLRLGRAVAASLARADRLLAPEERPWLVPLALLLAPLPPEARGAALARVVVRPADRALVLAAPERAQALLHRLAGPRARGDRGIHEASREESLEVVLLALVTAPREATRRRIRRFLTGLRGARPDISGRDLLGRGIPQGPRIAAGLRRALQAKLEGKDRDGQLRAALRAARTP